MLSRNEVATASSSLASTTAIVVDASFSMRYRLEGSTLFSRAQKQAKEIIQRLADESSSTLVICDGRPFQVEPPGFDRTGLVRRLSDAEPSHLPSDMTGCISAAARALGESPLEGKKIYVVGDLTKTSLPLDGPPPRVPTPAGEVLPELVFVDVAGGKALPNLALVDLTIAPSAELGARGFEIAVVVRNSSDKAVEGVALALEVEGVVVTRGFVDAAPHASSRKVLAHRFEPGTRTGRVVLEADSLPEDDVRPFVVRVPSEVRALVVDGAPSAIRHQDEAFFVDAAFGPGRSGGRITATFLDADAAEARSLSDFDVVLLLNVGAPRSTFIQALEAFVKAGGGLFVSLGDQVDPDAYDSAFGGLLPRRLHLLRTSAEPDAEGGPPPARIARVDQRHPAMRIFEGASEGFDTARIWRHMLLEPEASEGEQIIASLDDGSPMLIEAPRGRGRVILYTSTVDRDWSDWPIRTSFLPAIQQLTAYLAGGLDESSPRPLRVGEAPRLSLPDTATLEAVLDASGRELTSPTFQEPGLFTPRISLGGETRTAPELAFPVVLEPKESDTSRHAPETLEAFFGGDDRARVTADTSGALQTSGTPLWSWLLAAGVFFFFMEGLLVRRA